MRPTRVSYSAISTFEACPLSYKLHYLDDIKSDRPRPAADRGTRLHLACERYLKNEIALEKLPIDFRVIKKVLVMVKEMGAKAEEVWLTSSDWNIQDEESEDTLIKSVVDIHWIVDQTLYIYDLKTGRKYAEHADQLQLYAAMGKAKYPHVKYVHVAALYLEGAEPPTVYGEALLPHIQQYWKDRANSVLQAEEFPATPSADACRYCDYRGSTGGPCIYG